MPRMGRVVLPRYPHHIVQRGHNRQVVFVVEAEDYRRYLSTLREFKNEYGVPVYAFCLMTDHAHWLLAPDEPGGIGKLMKRLAGRQTHCGRGGTSRARCRPRGTCLPAAGISNSIPSGRAWSPSRKTTHGRAAAIGSKRRSATGWIRSLLSCLGGNDAERRARYRKFLQTAIPDGEWSLIRESVQRGQLTGTDRFPAEVAAITGRRVERRGQGRPMRPESKK